MSLFNYFKKASTSVTVNEGSVFLHNEGSARPEISESSAETSVASIASKGGKNVKRKIQTVTAAKRKRWNDDYVKFGFCRATIEEQSRYPSANCLFCPSQVCQLKYCSIQT